MLHVGIHETQEYLHNSGDARKNVIEQDKCIEWVLPPNNKKHKEPEKFAFCITHSSYSTASFMYSLLDLRQRSSQLGGWHNIAETELPSGLFEETSIAIFSAILVNVVRRSLNVIRRRSEDRAARISIHYMESTWSGMLCNIL